jgi:hypothetical protein
MQTKLLNIRLPVEELDEMRKLSDSVGLNPTILGKFFVQAALRTFKDGPQRLTLPVNFQIVEEPPTKPRK